MRVDLRCQQVEVSGSNRNDHWRHRSRAGRFGPHRGKARLGLDPDEDCAGWAWRCAPRPGLHRRHPTVRKQPSAERMCSASREVTWPSRGAVGQPAKAGTHERVHIDNSPAERHDEIAATTGGPATEGVEMAPGCASGYVDVVPQWGTPTGAQREAAAVDRHRTHRRSRSRR